MQEALVLLPGTVGLTPTQGLGTTSKPQHVPTALRCSQGQAHPGPATRQLPAMAVAAQLRHTTGQGAERPFTESHRMKVGLHSQVFPRYSLCHRSVPKEGGGWQPSPEHTLRHAEQRPWAWRWDLGHPSTSPSHKQAARPLLHAGFF